MTFRYPFYRFDGLHKNGSLVLLILTLLGIAWGLSATPITTAASAAFAVSAGLVLLRWPWLVWPTLAVALPVTSGLKAGSVSLTEAILLLAAFLWLVDGVRRNTVRLHPTLLLLPLALYGLVLCVSLLEARNPGEGVSEVAKWLEFSVVLVLLPTMVSTRKVPWLVASIVLAGVLQAAFGLYQFNHRIGPEWFMISEHFMRGSGSFMQPNPFAGYLGLVLPVAFSLAIESWYQIVTGGDRRVSAWAWSVYYSIGVIVLGAGLIASWGRGAWLGAAAGIAVVIVLHKRRRGMLGSLALLAGTIIILLVGSDFITPVGQVIEESIGNLPASFNLSQALTQEVTNENFSVIERLAHWVAALRMWDTAPWLGVGPGNYATAYPDVRLALWEEPLGHAHNIYLNVLAETGILGLFTFLLFWTSAIVWIWRRMLEFLRARRCLSSGPGTLLWPSVYWVLSDTCQFTISLTTFLCRACIFRLRYGWRFWPPSTVPQFTVRTRLTKAKSTIVYHICKGFRSHEPQGNEAVCQICHCRCRGFRHGLPCPQHFRSSFSDAAFSGEFVQLHGSRHTEFRAQPSLDVSGESRTSCEWPTAAVCRRQPDRFGNQSACLPDRASLF